MLSENNGTYENFGGTEDVPMNIFESVHLVRGFLYVYENCVFFDKTLKKQPVSTRHPRGAKQC